MKFRPQMKSPRDASQQILDRCRELGFALAGICDAAPTQYERELMEWLAAGKHGEMEYLRRNVDLRVDPRRFIDGRAKSIICVADRYDGESCKTGGESSIATGGDPRAHAQRPIGRIARYARGDDYHLVMKSRLHLLCKELAAMFPHETFRACVDTAPLLEREHAQRAGLGSVGKNTLLIQRGAGSYLLLGEIITTHPLAASQPAEPDPCSSCTRCIEACPTQAIAPVGWSVDATRCVSYLTIEHRDVIDEQYHRAIGDWIFGCDVCQEVCPHNQEAPEGRMRTRKREAASKVNSAYAARRGGFDLLDVLNWDEDARRAAFVRSAMKRAKLDMMKRNALIAAGNALRTCQNAALKARIEQIADDASESIMVKATAAIVLLAQRDQQYAQGRTHSG